jgi:hypothetical protein
MAEGDPEMRTTRRSRSAAAVTVLAAAVAASPAPATGAANGLEVTAENITAPEDVGRRIDVGIRGRITAISPGRIARRCRRTRSAQSTNISIAGEKYHHNFRHLSSTGRFDAQIELEYGGIPEDGSFVDGDVPFSGGRVTFTFEVSPTQVPRGLSPTDLKLYKCKRLKATALVEIPPSR